jgi:signal transduction histidine kinase
LSFVYVAAVDFMERQTEETIEAELTGLREQYRDLGIFGLGRIIAQRAAAETEMESIYLLIDDEGWIIAGNLEGWPEAEDLVTNRVRFAIDPAGSMGPRRFLGRTVELDDARLLVARDIEDKLRTQALLVNAIGLGSGLMLIFGVIGGFVMSRWMLSRIETINRTTAQIMDGDLGRRITVEGSGDEFDALAANLNAMLERIERLMAGMREVTDNIAHDLRTPLSRLRSRLEVALMNEIDPATARRLLEETVADAEGLIATFNALLSIARAEAGEHRASWERVELDALVQDIHELYEPLAEEREIELAAEIEPGVVVMGNRQMLAQALANLADNAIKYTPVGGRVTLRAAHLESGGRRAPLLEVADSGPGIAPDLRDKALQRFVRLESDRSTPGNGLGLSLVNAVAQLHNATLELADNAPGLNVSLVFAPPPPAPPAEAASRSDG